MKYLGTVIEEYQYIKLHEGMPHTNWYLNRISLHFKLNLECVISFLENPTMGEIAGFII